MGDGQPKLTAHDRQALIDAVLESMGDGVLAIDSRGTFIIANAAARRVFAEGAEVGQPLPADWAKIHRSALADGSELAPADGALGRALRGLPTDGLEFTLERPGGSGAIWVEATGRPVVHDDGRVVAGVAVYRDVTEKKRRADLFATLARNIPNAAVVLFDRALRCLALDGSIPRIGGTLPQDQIGCTLRELAGLAPGDTSFDRIESFYRRTLAGATHTIDFLQGPRTLSLHSAPVRDALGHITAGIVLAVDVTAERRIEAALRKSEQVYRAIVEHLPSGAVMLVDRDLRYVAADGPAIKVILQRAKLDSMVGRTVAEVSSEGNREALLDLYRRGLEGENAHLEVGLGGMFYDLSIVPIFDGLAASHVMVLLQDVTVRKQELVEVERARELLETQSITDELTGLLNRRGFLVLATQQMKVSTRKREKLVLLFVDLNGMKAINDTFGHEMGDRALYDTGELLRTVFRASDVLARLGGDEFVVLATDALATSGPLFRARLADAVGHYNARTESPFRLAFSVGTSIFDPETPKTLETLLSESDASMYEEKKKGPGVHRGGGASEKPGA